MNHSLKERVEMEEVNEVAPISALLRVHDMNYVMKVMKMAAKQVGEQSVFVLDYTHVIQQRNTIICLIQIRSWLDG